MGRGEGKPVGSSRSPGCCGTGGQRDTGLVYCPKAVAPAITDNGLKPPPGWKMLAGWLVGSPVLLEDRKGRG